MFLRIDKLQIELPKPAQADPESAGVVQDLLGGKFGEMFIDWGFHRILYCFSPNDYTQLSEIWNGEQFDTGEPREVQDGPPEGGEVPDLTPAPPLYAPGVIAEDIAEIAQGGQLADKDNPFGPTWIHVDSPLG